MANLTHSYQQLGPAFFSMEKASPFNDPELIIFNQELALKLELDQTVDKKTLGGFYSGQIPLPGSSMISQAYAGHQFGHFVPQLGDGRAILLGEVNIAEQTYDLQLKGAGPTTFSRGGDGFSSIGPVLREYLVSEAMHALGIPTTRSLAAVASGQMVYREQLLPGAILTRVSKGHIRVGTFEFFACRGDIESLKKLTEYSIKRFYPHLATDSDRHYLFFESVCKNLIELVSKWMGIGFIHGVMNTDNTSICGETLDYGPCAFMDYYNEAQVYSFIDRYGRYAYNQQPAILQWNMARLADCLLPMIEKDRLQEIINTIPTWQKESYRNVFCTKLGYLPLKGEEDNDDQLIADYLFYLQENQLDFTNSFRSLCTDTPVLPSDEFKKKWELKISNDKNQALNLIRNSNPFIIPRNHQIEKIISQVVDQQDYQLFLKFHQYLNKPFEDNPEAKKFTLPPEKNEVVKNTFCGT